MNSYRDEKRQYGVWAFQVLPRFFILQLFAQKKIIKIIKKLIVMLQYK